MDHESSRNSSDRDAKKATTGLVLGIIGLVAWCLPIVGLPVTVIGLVMSLQALSSSQKNKAITAAVLCVLGLLFSIANAAVGAYLGATGQHPLVN
jgi:biopolymer transport protein ExbB/TolQ